MIVKKWQIDIFIVPLNVKTGLKINVVDSGDDSINVLSSLVSISSPP